MPDFRQKRRISQMLRQPKQLGNRAAGLIASNSVLLETIISMRKAMLSPGQVRQISKEVYGDEGRRLEKLRDDAVIAINEICILHPAYRTKINRAVKEAINAD
jgi:hypothetical protein